ncbi:aminotransferase [Sphingosinicella sp. LY1275]|uniref:aminotransferase n=1 Tax=Sphingosinicella sp. LY1275 TaxID=3095379 RepID=UPI002ADECAE7|nr:aminotransferase [Sphingosinicella sp. LY1275]MEA1015505.1 aminotransferase [Sphingosinicella sp. LY1275]
MNPLFADQPTTIFEHMSGLAREHGAVNLGQGFPDFGWPEDVLAKAGEALAQGSNQYPPMRGLPELRQAVAHHYHRHQGRDVAPDQVIVTSGATEALTAAIMALVSPGDEVVLFQPLYDSYLPMVKLAGGVPKLVNLAPPEWRLTREMLEAAITDRTRLVIFNNPHNPTARAFDAEEVRLLAEACVRHDALALSDEVWEHLAFDGRAHVPLASMPGMAARTVKVGSAGKIFSLTGWKVGWAVVPPDMAKAVANAHQFLTFTTAPNLQAAVAYGLGKEPGYFDRMRTTFAASRDFLVNGLRDADYVTLPAEGTYFVTVDLAASGVEMDDAAFCERAVREAGVAAIPVSALYADNPVRNVIRLCFAKKEETLRAGILGLAEARAAFAERSK